MRRSVITVLMLVGMLAVSGRFASASASLSDGSANYYHPYPTNVEVGDIVFGHSPDVAWLIPGYWTHVGIIAYYNYSINDWEVVEAYYPKVHVVPLRDFMKRYDTFAIARVNAPDYIKYEAVEFALNQIGKPYSFDYFKKPSVYDSSYYCSELVWASYMYASDGQINLDANPGWSWTYGYAVAPQEIWDSSWTYAIYYDSDS